MSRAIQVNKTIRDGRIKYNYKDVQSEFDGWIDVKKYLPADYDLCLLKTASRILHGWYALGSWDGLKLKDSDVILYWKRKKDDSGT